MTDTSTMVVTVKLFAIYREMLGQSELTVDVLPGQTVAETYNQVLGAHAPPGLQKSTMFAINESYVSPDTVVQDGDRLAFIPPVSGG